MTRCFFPLRTSVEWFDNPESPAIEGRIKQAAVLYDELLFEDGMVEIDITDHGAIHGWRPADDATEEQLDLANRRVETGSPVTLSIGVQPAKGAPAARDGMRVVMAGSLTRRYVAELMYTVMPHFAEYNDGWAQITFTGGASPNDLDRWLPHQSTRTLWDDSVMADLRESDPWLRDYIVKSFDRDALLARQLEATFNVSPLFSPMLSVRQYLQPSANRASQVLRHLFPDVSDLPWEVVMEFREHDAVKAARARLHAAVERAARDGMTVADNQLTRDMVFAAEDIRKKHALVERLTKMAVSVVPIAGGAVSEGVGAAADQTRERADWVAALSLLRARG